MMRTSSRDGYILLLSILIVGIVASAVVTSTLLLATDAQRTAFVVEQSNRAASLAQGCAEYALDQLRSDTAYAGNETLSGFASGESCTILPVGGAGNNNRIICTEARIGDAYRRIEVVVQTLLPVTSIYSWQEVPSFSVCD